MLNLRLVWFAVLALGFAVVQQGRLVLDPGAPDMPLALAAWGMVDGDEDGVLPRAWIAGFCVDLIDPGSVCFHLVGFTLLALAFLPVRRLLFRTRGLAWALWALVCTLVLAVADHRLAGLAVPWRACWTTALMTAVAAIAIGGFFAWIPAELRPLGKAGA